MASWVSFLLFYLFAFIILAVAYMYVSMRIIIPAKISRKWKNILKIISLLLFFMPFDVFLMRILDYNPPWITVFSWIAFVSLGFFSLLSVFLLSFDIILLIIRLIKKINRSLKPSTNTDNTITKSPVMTRRRLLINSTNYGILGITGMLTGYGIYEARRYPDIKKINIPLNNLPKELSGLKIVQITDMHAGTTIDKSFMNNIVTNVNKLKPDIVAITGDLVDGTVNQLEKIVSPLSELSPKFGSYFVTGNHEYYSGVTPWLKKIENLGITVLNNEHKIITPKKKAILLAGVTDFNADRIDKSHKSDPLKAISGAPENITKILLAHQPRSIYAASKAGFDFQISGHTHGGQYFPWNFFVKLQQPYINGLHKFKDTWIYISNGTGYWGPPLRIGAPPEITEITLVTA